MSEATREARWESRFAATEDYVFGTAPNAFLAAQAHRIAPGGRVLSVADGEGRNGVFLAGLGLDVHTVEVAPAAIAKARRLAIQRGVNVQFEQANLLHWAWPEAAYDAVVAIFVQFVTADERPAFFAHLIRALKPGGVLLLQGYRPEQLNYRTGGPSEASQCYTEAMLLAAFAALRIESLHCHDAIVHEGAGHAGMSALIDLVAYRPPA
ncbi:SAM-dependent methyltransferase [Acidiphilium sp.]|uniref:SAM-dependent methyltransferase n=1 Tax=Acidiphilium sp. TaxID=527 RepID=UPI003D06091A